jgi:hypothetical protein
MRGLVVFGIHLIGETVFWLKSLYQLGFVRSKRKKMLELIEHTRRRVFKKVI